MVYGVSVVHTLINLLLQHQQSDSDYILVPAGGVTGPGYKTGSEAPENIRKSRTVNSEPKTMTVLNSLSSKALATIEGLAMIKNDNIECFQRALCQNSKFSKTLEGPRKLWIHFWRSVNKKSNFNLTYVFYSLFIT